MELSEIKKRAPWNKHSDWERVISAIKQADRAMGSRIEPLRQTARDICQHYEDMAGPIESICKETCPACTDVCCARATLWYDFKDLLYIYFSAGTFPGEQIYKKRHGDSSVCCYLTKNGCTLPRNMRPFVCTWYFCPDQKKRGRCMGPGLQDIKILRNRLEKEYTQICHLR